MKLFLIERTEAVDYDEYDSCVVCAEDADTAIDMSVKNCYLPKDKITCELIGEANDACERGIVLGSFNAG